MYSLASYLEGEQRKPTRGERKAKAKREANFKARHDGGHTEEEWRALCVVYSHRCAYCGRERRLTKDHVRPISKGGDNSIRNLVPSCKPCNLRKGSRIVDPRPSYLLPSMEAALKELDPEMRAALGLG